MSKKIRAALLAVMESRARQLASLIHDMIDPYRENKMGFALLLFSFDGSESTYVSNAQREDMIKFMREMLAHLETGVIAPHGHPNHPANNPGES